MTAARWLAGALALAIGALEGPAFAAQAADQTTVETDPLDSPLWSAMRAHYLPGGEVQFDSRVQVMLPAVAENALEVPVEIHAPLEGVQEIVVIADLNPIPEILRYFPEEAKPQLAFRFKVEQSTPVRAAARTADGVWHVGGAWLGAAGGGCTAPSMGTGSGLWHDHLNEVNARLWPRADGEHLKLRVTHPMDTGLAAGIPSFHIDTLKLQDAEGHELARLVTFEPVSENPVLDFELENKGPVHVTGVDTNGNKIDGRVAP